MNLLESGVYSIPEAARLLRVNPKRVRGWVAGYPQTYGSPIIKNQLEPLNGKVAISFINLMEARFIAYFSSYGVHVNSIRRIAEEAAAIVEHQHPFATDTIFKTDGRAIFADVAFKEGDKALQRLYDLKSKNWTIREAIEASLLRGVEFDASGLARNWQPRPDIDEVIVTPRCAFGHPVLRDSGVPTKAIFDACNAEGETYKTVSHWYQVPEEHVKKAVRFEVQLAAAA